MGLAWERFAWERFRGVLENVRVELGARSLGRLRVDAVRLEAARVRLAPGLPPRVEVRGPGARVSIDQSRLDGWTRRNALPFELRLTSGGLLVRASLTGIPVSEFQTRLEIVDGWFVMRPRRAAFLGVPSPPAPRLPFYLPLPSISKAARLRALEHAPSRLHLHLDFEDFEEELSRGLAARLRSRFVSSTG